jgi:hypothetical protein
VRASEATLLTGLLPVVTTLWSKASGAALAEVQIVFVVTALPAIVISLITEPMSSVAVRLRRRLGTPDPTRILAGGVVLAAALAAAAADPLGAGARTALVATAAATVALALPPIDGGHATPWRLWLFISVIALTVNPAIGVLMAIGAAVGWIVARAWHRAHGGPIGRTVAELAEPLTQIPLLDDAVPVVNGSAPAEVADQILARHPRILVQVGDVVIGELNRGPRAGTANEGDA